MKSKKNAAPGTTGSGDSYAHGRAAYTPSAPQKEHETYYLHVRADGTEEISAVEPRGVKSLLIERRGPYEFTRTKTIQRWDGANGHFTDAPPKGAGWEVADTSADKWTGWRRKLPPEAT